MKYLLIIFLAAALPASVMAQAASSVPRSLIIAEDGTVLVGTSASNADGWMQMKLIAYNADGSLRGTVVKTFDNATPMLMKACASSGDAVVVTGTGGDASSALDIGTFGLDINTIVSIGDVPVAVGLFTLDPAYPNPVSGGAATVSFTLQSEDNYRLSIRDISGKEIQLVEEAMLPRGTYRRAISTADLGNGSYFVILQTASGIAAKKLLVVR